jgi:hypothetical protein
MALEKGFIYGHILDPDDFILFQIQMDDPIDEKERIAVGQNFLDLLCAEYEGTIRFLFSH